MPPLSNSTVDSLRCALTEKALGRAGDCGLQEAMSRIRTESADGTIGAADLMDALQAIIAEVPVVKQATGSGERDAAVQRLAEACLSAYYAMDADT